jgi:hypothetical protein
MWEVYVMLMISLIALITVTINTIGNAGSMEATKYLGLTIGYEIALFFFLFLPFPFFSRG